MSASSRGPSAGGSGISNSPRPRSANALRNLLLVDQEKSVALRQLALMRNNLVIGGLMDAQTRLRETSGLAADFYRKRSNFDI